MECSELNSWIDVYAAHYMCPRRFPRYTIVPRIATNSSMYYALEAMDTIVACTPLDASEDNIATTLIRTGGLTMPNCKRHVQRMLQFLTRILTATTPAFASGLGINVLGHKNGVPYACLMLYLAQASNELLFTFASCVSALYPTHSVRIVVPPSYCVVDVVSRQWIDVHSVSTTHLRPGTWCRGCNICKISMRRRSEYV